MLYMLLPRGATPSPALIVSKTGNPIIARGAPRTTPSTMVSRNALSLDSPKSYAVAWLAALPIARAAAEAMLDEKHAAPAGFNRHQTDANGYTWGCMGEYNIVIVSLTAGAYRTTSAATTASRLLASLLSIRVGNFVGIGGGIPRPDESPDVRLGDVVVSQPDGTTGGVCQYDLYKVGIAEQYVSRIREWLDSIISEWLAYSMNFSSIFGIRAARQSFLFCDTQRETNCTQTNILVTVLGWLRAV